MKQGHRLGSSRSSVFFPLGLWAIAATACLGGQAPAISMAPQEPGPQLMDDRFLTVNSVVRMRQIEVTRDTARGQDDFIDCVNLDGWSVDVLCARIPGARTVNGERWRSRQGVGPIETLLDMGTERGLQAMLATTAAHFDDGFARNGFAWMTCGWEMCLVEGRKIYGYGGRNGMEGLRLWLTEIRKRWPDTKLIRADPKRKAASL